MKKEIKIFFTALMFYTRIPCPTWTGYSEDNLNNATRYLPLIGWIVGFICGLVVYVSHFLFPSSICVILGLMATILVTGAFHEDGFADVCDGFGGGWTKEKILEIMKDSRIGAFGVIGVFLLFSLKIAILIEIMNEEIEFCIKTIILSHVLSRFIAVTMIFTDQYARSDLTSKVKPIARNISTGNLFVSAIWVIPAFILLENYGFLLVIIPVYLTKIYLSKYFKKWIGGYTGDCLGATQQITEIVILLSCFAIWRYI